MTRTTLLVACGACAALFGACSSSDDDAPAQSHGPASRQDSDGGVAGKGAADDTPPAAVDVLVYLDWSGRVLSIRPDATKDRVIVGAEDADVGPDGVAIDVEAGHIYWTNMGAPNADDGSIQRADLDGSNVETVVPAGGTFTPKQLKLDPVEGKLYWADREGMRVMRANLDGSEIETLVTTGSGDADRADASRWCVGMALDPERRQVYWTQKGPDGGGVGSIKRASMDMPPGEDADDRSDIETLFEDLPEPIDLELDLAAGHLYWTDRGDDTVNRAGLDVPAGETPANRSDREVLVENVSEAIGIALDLDGEHLFFTSLSRGLVGMANLDGSEPKTLTEGKGVLTGIAFVRLPE